MTSNRVICYQAMKAHAPLMALLPGGIHQASSLNNVPDKKPFLVHRMHNGLRYQRGLGDRSYLQVWVHDVPGDYMRIDEVIELVKSVLEAVPAQGSLLQVRWLEDSVDLQDDDMGTICRNSRYELTNTNMRS